MKEDYKKFTKDDFLNSVVPFEWLYGIKDSLEFNQAKSKLKDYAKGLKIPSREFENLCKAYAESVKAACTAVSNTYYVDGIEKPFELGGYTCNENGVTDSDGSIICNHLIIPIGRTRDINTNIQGLIILFVDGKDKRTIYVPRKDISDARAIIGLTDYGIDVTSKNAKALGNYLIDVARMNYDILPETKLVSKLGWTYGNKEFLPYSDGIEYGGGDDFRPLYDAVCSAGDAQTWIDEMRKIRANKNVDRIVMAASAASPLLHLLNCQPFILHLYGKSGYGKTIALHMGASIWGNPRGYVGTMNSTSVSQELTAAFLNNLPLCLDELETMNSKGKTNYDDFAYWFCEGKGRGRGKKTGGIQEIGTWCSIAILNGETPIIATNSRAGAMNRIIEIKLSNPLFDKSDAGRFEEMLCGNYGHAGKMIIDALRDADLLKNIKEQYQTAHETFAEKDITGKQANAAAAIYVGDVLLDYAVFRDGITLDENDLAAALKTNKDIDANIRAWEFLKGKIAENENRFASSCGCDEDDKITNLVGRYSNGCTCIISTVFNDWLDKGGYNPRALLDWLIEQGCLDVEPGRRNKPISMRGGGKARCVCIRNDALDED